MNFQAIRGGFVFGILVASAYTAYVGVLYLVRGSAPFEAHDVTFWSLVISYYLGFGLGGIVVGALAFLARFPEGAVLVGILGALCVMIAIGSAIEGPVMSWTGRNWMQCVLAAVPLGAFAGVMWWKHERPRHTPK
jgi:hypothetical protein